MVIPIAPQSGPQTRFCQSGADILVFGGEAGGGKSWILTYEASKWTHVPGYGAILFRRDTTQLTGPGGLWEKARALYLPMGAELVQSPTHVARWETETSPGGLNGAEVHFRHLQHEGTEDEHDGKEYAFVGFDEGQYFTERQIWYLWGRCRTMCGVRPYMRITCNPDPDCYLRTLLDWWIDPETGLPIPERDGVIRWCLRLDDKLTWFDTKEEAEAHLAELRKLSPGIKDKPISVSFIRSRFEDNPALVAEDPDYQARIAMQDADSRAKKLDGNWNSRPKAGEMFNRSWFGYHVTMPHRSQILHSVRGWDKAATLPSARNPDPDWTAGVLWHAMKNGMVTIGDVVKDRLPPGGVDALIVATAQMDGPDVEYAFWVDPGQAGLVDQVHIEELFKHHNLPNRVSFEVAVKNKIQYAKPWAAYADPKTGVGKIYLVRGPWNAAYLSELEKFPKPAGKAGVGVHDDQVDASSRCYLAVHGKKSATAERFKKAMGKAESSTARFFRGD